MANLKEIRNRITSINSTMQITSAMKLVSAAKLKRAQDRVHEMRPYADKLRELLVSLSASLEGEAEGAYTQVREVKKVLIIAVTSNRGLCGGFNAQILRKVNLMIQNEYAGKHVEVLGIGRKASDAYFKREILHARRDNLFDDLTYNHVAATAEEVMEAFVEGKFDEVRLVYNHFKNAATQIIMNEAFLPVEPVETDEPVALDYIFEPGKEEIVKDLVPKSLKIQLFKAVLDSNAAEHGARMTAMHQATDNAKDLKHDLSLKYNKARQAAITNEILEIVAGAEALNG